jgi:hypothetical protein
VSYILLKRLLFSLTFLNFLNNDIGVLIVIDVLKYFDRFNVSTNILLIPNVLVAFELITELEYELTIPPIASICVCKLVKATWVKLLIG